MVVVVVAMVVVVVVVVAKVVVGKRDKNRRSVWGTRSKNHSNRRHCRSLR